MACSTDSLLSSLSWKFHALPVLDLESATAKLSKGESSYIYSSGELGLVSRCDTVQLASNEPIEDYIVSSGMDVGKGQKWHAWGVYDGHAGRHTASVLSHSLIPYLSRSLKAHFEPLAEDRRPQDAIKSSFVNLDNEILADGVAALSDARSQAEAQARLAPCYAGSCALLAVYDPEGSTLHVVNTGDSRAVLGRRSAEGQGMAWSTIPLSDDHAAANPKEVERVKALHPNEEDLITHRDGDCERYVGIAVTRAFGDARWKWSKEQLVICEKKYAGRLPPPSVIKPPYLEATPDIQSVPVQQGDFMILASDGLWNHLSSEDAVHAVGLWVEAMKGGTLAKIGEGKETAVGGGPAFMDQAEGISFADPWKVTRENIVVEDKNAATHLVKNAFGGSQRQLFTAVMTVDSPTSRMMRDDVTVQVVFFDDV